jgi:hypothetical protein
VLLWSGVDVNDITVSSDLRRLDIEIDTEHVYAKEDSH